MKKIISGILIFIMIFSLLPVTSFASESDDVTVWFYCENPQEIETDGTSPTHLGWIADQNIVVPMQQVTVTSSDVTRINSAFESNSDITVSMAEGITVAHVFVKALENMYGEESIYDEDDPHYIWEYVQWDADGTIASIDGKTTKAKERQLCKNAGEKLRYYAISDLNCIVGTTPTSKDYTTPMNISVSEDDRVVRMSKYAIGAAHNTNDLIGNATIEKMFATNTNITVARYENDNVYMTIPATPGGNFEKTITLYKQNGSGTINFGSNPNSKIEVFTESEDGSSFDKITTPEDMPFSASFAASNPSAKITITATNKIKEGIYYIRVLNNNANLQLVTAPPLNPVDYMVVEVTATGAEKGSLRDLLADVPDPETDTKYYHDVDRYNGNPNDTISPSAIIKGFWASLFSVGGPLENAKDVEENPASTQDEVDQATIDLTAAIAKLIPTTNINATALYEELQTSNELEEDDYTAVSWPGFEAARTTAQAIFTNLFDDDGNPTEYNSSTEGTAAADVTSATAALTAAREILLLASDSSSYSSTVSSTKTKINTLKEIISRNSLKKSDYTDDSWSDYQEALAAAATAPVLTGTPADTAAVDAYKAAYAALYNAYYCGLQPKEEITIDLTWNDRITSKAYKGEVKLQGDCSLAAALAQKDLNVSHVGYDEHVYINGVYLDSRYSCVVITSLTKSLPDLSDIILHPGDQVSIIWNNSLSSTMSPTLGETIAQFWQYEDSLKVSGFIQEDGISVEEGKPLNLDTTEVLSAFDGDGASEPAECLTLYVSGPMSSTGGACTVTTAAVDGESVTTGSDGSAALTLYEEGWYLVGAYDIRGDIKGNIPGAGDNSPTAGTYYSVKSGALIWVHVTASSDPAAVKADLKDKLDEVYEAYPESYFRNEPCTYYPPEWPTAEEGEPKIGDLNSWPNLKAAYDKAAAGIAAAETIGEAYQAQQTGIVTIKAIRDDTTNENTQRLAILRDYLSRLPDDSKLITQSIAGLAGDCAKLYDSLSGYQYSRLSQMEIDKCEMVKAAAKELPAEQTYNLTYEISADTADVVTAIEDMIQYLQDHNTIKKWGESPKDIQYQDFGLPGNQGKPDSYRLLQFYTASDSNVYKVAPDTRVLLNIDIGQYSYLLVREDPDHCITGTSGAAWTISDESFKLDQDPTGSLDYDVVRNMTVKVNGTEYELKSIEFEGIDDWDVTFANAPSFIDRSTYQGRPLNDPRVNIIFPDSKLNFKMPYEDVKVIFNWGTVGSAEDLEAAKQAAESALQAKYDSLDPLHNYTTNGKALLAVMEAGIAKINDATTLSDVASAKNAALAAMMAVSADIKPTPPEGVVLPNYGDVVGSVWVSVRNDTFKGGDFTGNLLSGWYDLCAKDTMMTVILKALATEGYTWSATGANAGYNYNINYIASIEKGDKKLAEFSGEAGSGWMGTLNDWFTNEGFSMFSVGDGTLENGDSIEVQYTQNKGEDIGGTWGNSDTSLKALSVSGGTLAPSFKGSILEYTLLIDKERASVILTPTASNKNYLVKAFLNYYNRDSAFYKRTESISVKDGDIIYVGVGDLSWPSMNKQGDEAREYKGTKYIIKVKKSNVESVIALIAALPDASRITYAKYENYKGEVEAARVAYDALTEKSEVTNYAKLTAAEAKIDFYREIDAVKDLLAAIPSSSKITLAHKDAVMAADAAYKALSDEQKKYIIVGDVTNYNVAIDRLTALGAFKSGNKPSPILPSSEIPMEGGSVELQPETVIIGNEGKAKISDADAKKALEDLKTQGGTELLIQPKLEKAVDKLTVEIPKSALKEVADDTKAVVTIKSNVGEITLSQEALKTIAKEAGSNVSITAERLDNSKLSEENKALVGDNPVFDLSIGVDGKAVKDFKGNVRISLPYTPKQGENVKKLTVYYIDDTGKATVMTGAYYDEKTGAIVFNTNHFSTFAIVYDKNKMIFDDVKEEAWYFDAVNFAVNNNLFNGTSDTMFSPDAKMTRAMLVTVLYRMDQTAKAVESAADSFADVKFGQWYTDAVIWADANGIATGIGNELFGTNNNVTREQLAAILYNYAEYKGYDVTKLAELNAFADVAAVKSWAQDAMKWANAEGLINGRTKDTLVPGGSATRAEVAAILQRFVENIAK